MDIAYAYANARVKAMRAKLLDKNQVRELMDVGTLAEVIELLEETPYKSAFVTASTREARGMDLVVRALDVDLVEQSQKILAMTPKQDLRLVKVLLSEYAINNVKIILAELALGRTPKAEELVVLENSRLLRNLLACKDFASALNELEAGPYRAAVVEARREFEKTKDFRVILNALDHAYWRSFASACAHCDDRDARRFLELKLAAWEGIALLRMKHSGMSSQDMERVLKPRSPLGMAVLAAQQYDQALALVQAKFSLGEVEDLALVELGVDKHLCASAKGLLSRSVLSVGAIVAYLHLKQEELRSVRNVAFATQFNAKDGLRAFVISVVD